MGNQHQNFQGGKGKGLTSSPQPFLSQKSKIRIHMLACGQRHLSAETKLQSTNIPRIATPLSPHPGTEVSFLKGVSGGGIQTHLVMPRLPSSVATQVWVRKIPTSFFRMKMCRDTFHPNDT